MLQKPHNALITVDGWWLVRPNLAREHGGINKGDADKEEEDIVYEISTQVSLVHGYRE